MGYMQYSIYEAALEGDTSVLEDAAIAERGEAEYLLLTPHPGNNLLHIAARHGHLAFIRKAVARFPDLLRGKNEYDNTPLHEAAKVGTKENVELLISHLQKNEFTRSIKRKKTTTTAIPPYVLERNRDGDTPFHVALRFHNLAAAEVLFGEATTEILVVESNSGETPMHLYVRCCPDLPRPVEEKQKLIDIMMRANPWTIFKPDSNGLSPLMRAAGYGRVHLILNICNTYKQSLHYRDSKERSFLHYLRLQMGDLNARDRDNTLWICEKILQVDGVDTLTFSSCDEDGNTPLHSAILDRDFELTELILKHCVKARRKKRKLELIVNIKNNEGKTAFDLISSFGEVNSENQLGSLKNLMEQASIGTEMDEELYEAAKNKDVNMLSRQDKDDDYFLSRNNAGSNIIHIALQNDKGFIDGQSKCIVSFIKEAMERFPTLMYEKDFNGDTPLHIAAKIQLAINYIWEIAIEHWRKNNKLRLAPPWKLKNSRGQTPLHEAAHTSLTQLSALYDHVPPEALSDVNDESENVYHLIARHSDLPDTHPVFVRDAAYMRDVEGLTPASRAAQIGQLVLLKGLFHDHAQSSYIRDYKGRTMLHHLATSDIKHRAVELPSLLANDLHNLLFMQDDDGNTPLHLAIIHQNFELAQFYIKEFAKVAKSLRDTSTLHYKMEILMQNMGSKDGKSIKDLIECGTDIPRNLKKLIEPDAGRPKLDDQVYKAAATGQSYVLLNMVDEELIRQCELHTHDGSNIIHIALRHHRIDFIKDVFAKYVSMKYSSKDYRSIFEFLYKKDSRGDTPLHIAAGLQNSVAFEFFMLCLYAYNITRFFYVHSLPPWTVRNSKGNTFQHEAARSCTYDVMSLPSHVSPYILEVVNNLDETVLHVIAKYATYNAAKDFLEKHSKHMKSLVYVRDWEGFTPVLRAVQFGRLGMARFLIQQHPGSVDISDNRGRTVLHHLKDLVADLVDDFKDILPVWKDFLKPSEVDKLRTAQDDDGNTPLHLAIMNAEFTKTKFFIELCLQSETKRELDIVNNDGHSIFDLLSSKAAHIPIMKELEPMVNRSYIKERDLIDEMMDETVYKAAIKGEIQIFRKVPNDVETGLIDIAQFTRQTPGGSNIIHIALRHGTSNVEKFVEIALRDFPILSMRPDSNGDTPLHLAAKSKSEVLLKLLIQASKTFLNKLDDQGRTFHVAPWAVKNYKGSFPIHEALQADNLIAAKALLICDNEASSRVNDLGETPLHAFAKNGFSSDDVETNEFVKKLIALNNQAAYKRDDEGLTPLLSAARSGRFQVARSILKICPQSAYLRDLGGRTFLHLLHFTGDDIDESLDGTFKSAGKQLFDIPEADAQRLVQDYEGNTPLHYAIKTHNSIVAIVLTQRCLEDENQRELGLLNKEGQAIPDLLASHDVPNEIIELFRKKVPKAVYLARSSYGIRKTEMKESANALSVVAGLLATITFAAAFQVPGGFDGDDGSPILLKKPAFVVFVVANTIAMCCSMLCLFLLLWVMGIGKIHGSLMVLDISIILLRLSFYLTLLAFTMGVFVNTVKKNLWLAILVCVLSFLTFLLTWKNFIQLVTQYGTRAITTIKKFEKIVKSSIAKCMNTRLRQQHLSLSRADTEEANVANQ